MPAVPVELKIKRAEKRLDVTFDDGAVFQLPAELLRVESPSAETKGHGGEKPPPPAGKKDVGIVLVEPVGHYAVRIAFTDGHGTGIYTWSYLYELGVREKELFAGYLNSLEQHGLSREPPT